LECDEARRLTRVRARRARRSLTTRIDGRSLRVMRHVHQWHERDDKNWLKTTKAYFAPDADEPKFEFEPVDVSLIPRRARKY